MLVCLSLCQLAVLHADCANSGHGALQLPDELHDPEPDPCHAGGTGGHWQDVRGPELCGTAGSHSLQRPHRQHVRQSQHATLSLSSSS
jgi:hypothetical protein